MSRPLIEEAGMRAMAAAAAVAVFAALVVAGGSRAGVAARVSAQHAFRDGSSLHGLSSPQANACPSASTVASSLKPTVKIRGVTSTIVTYAGVSAKNCGYTGTLIRITFHPDTEASFAAGEGHVSPSILVKIKGFGKAAWTTSVGSDFDVFNGSETVSIVAPLATVPELEALVRKIPGF